LVRPRLRRRRPTMGCLAPYGRRRFRGGQRAGVGIRTALAGFVVWVRPLQNLWVMLADQVTARQIECVDRMERDDERYPTTVEGSVRLIDSY
jgi:hypothetical protein